MRPARTKVFMIKILSFLQGALFIYCLYPQGG